MLLLLALPALAQAPAGSILWLRADYGVLATGGKVTTWRDASGFGNDARQDIPEQRPTQVSKGANGLPVIRFNGANHMVGASVFPVRADYSLTFVVKINNFGATNNIVSGNSHAHWLGGDRYPKVLHGGNFNTQAVSTVGLTPSFNVVTMTYRESGQHAAIYVNGIFAGENVTGPNVDSTLYLGAFATQNYMNGDLAEVLLYKRELSDQDRVALERYLIAKYAILTPQPYAPPAAGPLLWLKADSGVVTSGGKVTRWVDRSGHGYAAKQDSAALQPALLPNAMFNLPAVRFSGLGDFMEASPVFPVGSDYSLLFVVRLNDLGATNNVVSGNSHAHWFGGTPYAKVLHNGNFSTVAVSPIPVTASEFAIVTMTYLEARQRAAIYIDSYFADSALVGPNPDSTIYLGAFGKSSVLNGDLAEVLLYNRELSAADRKASETYLFRKYGIALPPPPPPPDSTFSQVPKAEQFYAREANDSAAVGIAGTVRLAGYDSIYVTIARNDLPWKRIAAPLAYQKGLAAFDLRPMIHAELSEYRFTIGVKSATADTVLAERDSIVCGDVFLINGQSNSIFGGVADTYEFFRTFGLNYSQSPRDTLWTEARADGFGGGPHVGAWGLRMGKLLMDRAQVPICIINGGVGGTSVEQHQRNDANPTDLGTIYGSMLYRVRKSGLEQKAKALLWYQGEANTITNYYMNFKALYEDWRSDYPGVRKFYVVQIRPGCAAGPHSELRELLRTLPDSLPDIESFSVMGVPGHDGCHYAAAGYDTIGTQLYRLVARDFYSLADTVDISAPDIRRAYYTDSSHTRLALLFTNARRGLAITSDSLVGGLTVAIRDAFFLDDTLSLIQSVRVSADTAFLTLTAPYRASTVAYIPSQVYPGTTVTYEGPWIRNTLGVGAFSFFRFPITTAEPGAGVDEPVASAMKLVAVPNPFTTRTELRATVARAGRLQVMLYDAVGREVRRLNFDARAGENSVMIERGDLPAGIYLCKIAGGADERVISIVVR
ncbi:MAG: Beta-lactamase protein [Chlorobi bacterium]|nr:Beta-lactamase protein [Chlorobiota bacterium]